MQIVKHILYLQCFRLRDIWSWHFAAAQVHSDPSFYRLLYLRTLLLTNLIPPKLPSTFTENISMQKNRNLGEKKGNCYCLFLSNFSFCTLLLYLIGCITLWQTPTLGYLWKMLFNSFLSLHSLLFLLYFPHINVQRLGFSISLALWRQF